jgi:hypothetical protein
MLADTSDMLVDQKAFLDRLNSSHILAINEFTPLDTGVQIADVYVGPHGMLTGSARVAQEAREPADQVNLNEEAERQKFAFESERPAPEGQRRPGNPQFR